MFSAFIFVMPISFHNPKDDLRDILDKAAKYCSRLSKISLFYTCHEEIVEKIYNPYKIKTWGSGYSVEKSSYLYDYQLIKKEEMQEKRTLLKENNNILNEKEAKLKTKRFVHKFVVFGPLGILSKEAQEVFHYSIEKVTTLWDIPVMVVRAIPSEDADVTWLYGKAWVSLLDGSIMKIEWEENSILDYQNLKIFANTINAEPSIKHSSEYRYIKNDVRFPSYMELIEDYIQDKPSGGKRSICKSELLVTYKDYKFFTVETDVTEIRN